jgi:hypothetical protein
MNRRVWRFASLALATVVSGVCAGPVGATAGPWRVQNMPDEQQIFLSDVSCSAANECATIGDGGAEENAAAHWNGRRWSLDAISRGGDGLVAVDCIDATFCVAVGANNLTGHPYIERWDGHRWNKSLVPKMPGASWTSLSDVTCLSRTMCIVVGVMPQPGQTVPLIGRFDGHTWAYHAGPVQFSGNDATNAFSSVACMTRTDCVAVGADDDGSSTVGQSFAEHFDGTRWKVVPVEVAPGGSLSYLVDVSCAVVDDCYAIGGGGVIEHWDGTAWKIVHGVPTYPDERLGGISCVPGQCVAVGGWYAGTHEPLVLAHDAGGGWSPEAPAANTTGSLNAVSCPTAATCVAVGDSINGDAVTGALLERRG